MKNIHMHKNYAFMKAKGKIGYNMTNDYMFRTVLQNNKGTLRGLVASIMNFKTEDIKDVTIENPIVIGDAMSDKEYRLDILVTLNSSATLNIEMQINNYSDWTNRSLVYLCREFDSLSHGELYENLKPVYQVSFIDFRLFSDHPEFFGKYQMRNVLDGYLYNSNFNLYVIELNSTDIATDDDIRSEMVTWVKLFKATTWEEIRMITKDNPSFESTAESIFISNADKNVVKRCREREDFYLEQEAREKEMAKLKQTIAEKDSTIAKKNSTIAEKDETIAEKNNTIAEKDALLQKYIEQFGD